MKSKVTGLIAVALITMLVIGCAKKPVVKTPIKETPKPTEVVPEAPKEVAVDKIAALLVTDMPDGRVDRSMLKLAVGESKTLYVRVMDSEGKYYNLPSGLVAKWSGRDIGRDIEVSPLEGNVVTVKLLKALSMAAFADVTVDLPDGRKMKGTITVEQKK